MLSIIDVLLLKGNLFLYVVTAVTLYFLKPDILLSTAWTNSSNIAAVLLHRRLLYQCLGCVEMTPLVLLNECLIPLLLSRNVPEPLHHLQVGGRRLTELSWLATAK